MNRSFHTPEFQEKKRKALLRRLYMVIALFVVIIGGTTALTYWKKIQIDTVRVNGTQVLSADDIQRAAGNFIATSHFLFYKKNNVVLYPHNGLIGLLMQQFPRVATVEVGLANYHTVSILLTERQPFAQWCSSAPQTAAASSTDVSTTPDTCYFMDDKGFVFAPSPDFSGDAYFKYYGLLPYASSVGSTYLSEPGEFKQLSDFVAHVKALQITPLYLVADSPHDFTLYLYGGGTIMFTDDDLATTADRLRLLLQKGNLIPLANGELQVQYIDLRYGDKVYYKIPN